MELLLCTPVFDGHTPRHRRKGDTDYCKPEMVMASASPAQERAGPVSAHLDWTDLDELYLTLIVGFVIVTCVPCCECQCGQKLTSSKMVNSTAVTEVSEGSLRMYAKTMPTNYFLIGI